MSIFRVENTSEIDIRLELRRLRDDGSGPLFVTGALRVDGHLLNEPIYLSISFIQLHRSASTDGNYQFVTCTCGEAGCAGIISYVRVTRDDLRVYWREVGGRYERDPVGSYDFDRVQYETTIRHAVIDFESARRALGGGRTRPTFHIPGTEGAGGIDTSKLWT